MKGTPFLSVVLPCRNQADHIGPVLTQYFAPLDRTGRTYELVVVPNASCDDTADVVWRLADKEPRITVVENAKGGWGLSVRTGLQAARGQVLCYTNSARTNPNHLPPLLDLYLSHAPCLTKARREKRGAPLREIGSFLYNLEGRLLYGIRAADINGTPKIFARDLYHRLDLLSQGDLLDLELMAQVARLGLPIVELPVAGFSRHGGKSSTTFQSAWRMYVGALRLRRVLTQQDGLRKAS